MLFPLSGSRTRPRTRSPGVRLLLPLVVAAASFAFPHPRRAVATHLNPIQIENALPGTTSWELAKPAGHNEIAGYASAEGVKPGTTISFFVSTTARRFSASIYRMGWYGGAGGRLMVSEPSMRGTRGHIPKPNPRSGLLICKWPVAFSVTIPDAWMSGIYLVKLTSSKGYQSYIPFTLEESRPHTKLLFIDTVTTSEAYNWWGGKSLYVDVNYRSAVAQYDHRAIMVSYSRPFAQNAGAGWILSWEIHMIRWLERSGYDVGYANDLNVNDDPSILLHRKGIVIAGHDEYWTAAIRNAMDNAVAHGVSLGNFAANTGYWQIRLARLGSNPDGIQICYKDFLRDPIHKTHPSLATVTWRSTYINRPESELLGAMYEDYEGQYGPFPWVVRDAGSWIFKGSHLRNGSSISGLVGHEEDAVLTGYPHPPNLQIVSSSPVLSSVGKRRISNGTVYTARSGAIVFNASTIDWSYGLDDIRQGFWSYPPSRTRPSAAAERITTNVLNAFLRTQPKPGATSTFP